MAGNLIHILLVLIIIGVVLYIVWWAISQVPLPPPIAIAVRVIFALIVAIIAIEVLLPLAGGGSGCGRLIC